MKRIHQLFRIINVKGLILLSGVLLFIMAMKEPNSIESKKYVVIGYVGGYNGKIINTDLIDANKLTHINYAFVNVLHNRAWLTNIATDTINFRKLNLLKQKNPDLKILISIGGGNWWSDGFSEAVLTDSLRRIFAKSAIDIAMKYDLDGVDIDWEFPGRGNPGEEDITYRKEDKQNFTLMFREIRRQINVVQQKTGKRLLLTTAVGARPAFLPSTEMDKVQQYLDYINLMTYDNSSGKELTQHHTNLYPSGKVADELSVQRTVKEFIAAGVPANKLVVGIGFYAHIYNVTTSDGNGFGQKVASRVRGMNGYTFIKDSLVNRNGYERYWDSKAMAPYLFNKEKKQFVSYDDEESVKAKCEFVQDNKLAGVMFWEYFSDPKGYLLNAINQTLE